MRNILIRSLLFIALFMKFDSASAQYVPLYKKKVPNFIDAPNNESDAVTGGILRISKVSVPGYHFYSAGNFEAPCVIICPGGGYSILAAQHEGTDVAAFFNSIGVHALVLKYRIPSSDNQVDKKYAPLQDAQQAIYLVRKNAKKWNVDPAKVGIMGFSAGGHLASSLAVHYNDPKIKVPKRISIRPDFQILGYPVISFGKFAHKGSRNNLLGSDTTEQFINYFSGELQVNAETPKAFIVHAKDDKAVPIENSYQYLEALKRFGIEGELYEYEKGGHGFGMNNKTSDVKWTDHLKVWMQKQGILK